MNTILGLHPSLLMLMKNPIILHLLLLLKSLTREQELGKLR